MAVTHSGERKRKKSGGRRKTMKDKRRYELGNLPTFTVISPKEEKRERARTKGAGRKVKIKKATYANVLVDPKAQKYQKVKLITEKENPANRNYARMNIITKGSIIDTEIGTIRVTSRPGQHGVVNAVLVAKK